MTRWCTSYGQQLMAAIITALGKPQRGAPLGSIVSTLERPQPERWHVHAGGRATTVSIAETREGARADRAAAYDSHNLPLIARVYIAAVIIAGGVLVTALRGDCSRWRSCSYWRWRSSPRWQRAKSRCSETRISLSRWCCVLRSTTYCSCAPEGAGDRVGRRRCSGASVRGRFVRRRDRRVRGSRPGRPRGGTARASPRSTAGGPARDPRDHAAAGAPGAVLPLLVRRSNPGRREGAPGGSAYTYLPASVRRFPEPQGLAKLMDEAGFDDIRWRLFGGGIVALHTGAAT